MKYRLTVKPVNAMQSRNAESVLDSLPPPIQIKNHKFLQAGQEDKRKTEEVMLCR